MLAIDGNIVDEGWNGDRAAQFLRGTSGTSVRVRLARRSAGKVPGVASRPEVPIPVPTRSRILPPPPFLDWRNHGGAGPHTLHACDTARSWTLSKTGIKFCVFNRNFTLVDRLQIGFRGSLMALFWLAGSADFGVLLRGSACFTASALPCTKNYFSVLIW